MTGTSVYNEKEKKKDALYTKLVLYKPQTHWYGVIYLSQYRDIFD